MNTTIEILELPISPTYARHWSVKDGIREIVANALDTHSEISVNLRDNTLKVRNSIGSLTRKNFVMGGTEKEGKDTIGQFGEGLKVGAMVLCRNGRKVSGRTGDFTFEFFMRYSEKWESEILNIQIQHTNHQEGTEVCVSPVTQQEMDEIKSIFLFMQGRKPVKSSVVDNIEGEIYSKGHGEIFCHGIKISDDYFAGTELSFNLFGLKLNRDRTIFSEWEINNKLGPIITSIDEDKDTIKQLFTMLMKHPKAATIWNLIKPRNTQIWDEIIRESYEKKKGAQFAIAKSDIEIRTLREWGFNPIPCSNDYMANFLVKSFGILTPDKALGNAAEYVISKNLTTKELETLNKSKSYALSILEKAYGYWEIKEIKNTKIWVFESRLNETDESNVGVAKGDTIGIRRSQFKKSKSLIGTLIHEYIHIISGAEDNSRHFEDELQKVLEALI